MYNYLIYLPKNPRGKYYNCVPLTDGEIETSNHLPNRWFKPGFRPCPARPVLLATILSLISTSLLDISFQMFCMSLECNQTQTKSTVSPQITVFALTFSFVKVTVSVSAAWNLRVVFVSSFPVRTHLAIQCPSQEGSCLSPSYSFRHYHGWGLIPSDPYCVIASELIFVTRVLAAHHQLIDPNIFSTLPWPKTLSCLLGKVHPYESHIPGPSEPGPTPSSHFPFQPRTFLPLYISLCFSFPFCPCSSHSPHTEWQLYRVQTKSFLDFHSQAILLLS